MNTTPTPPDGTDLDRFRARQRSRNRALGIVLGSLAILFFAITIVKMGIKASGTH